MKINIREDKVEIEGYVNAIERYSKPLMSRIGQFIERICKGAFSKAIKRNNDIHILLNHDWNRDLGSTKLGNLELKEDNIGLHARACITDKEVVEKARNGELVGWSFGFSDRDVENGISSKGIPTRAVKDLDLYEVSILDKRKTPAYDGTLICARAETGEIHFRGEDFIDDIIETPEEEINDVAKATNNEQEENVTEENQSRSEQQNDVVNNKESQEEAKPIDYSQYESIVEEIKNMKEE